MNSLDKQYQELLFDVMQNGTPKSTRNGQTKSVFGKQIRHNMKLGFPLLTTKKMYWKGIVTELLWFLRGDTNIKYLIDNGVHIWDGDAYKNFVSTIEQEHSEYYKLASKDEFIQRIRTDFEFAEKWGDLGPVYGKQWRDWPSQVPIKTTIKDIETGEDTYVIGTKYVDQIANLINDLRTNPDSRRLMVSAWNVGELHQMTLPPCHYGFQVYTRELSWEEQVQWVMKNTNVEMENLYIVEEIAKDTTPKRAISLMWNQRSVDTFLGLPFNIASYGLLLEILAKMTNMVPDELIGNLGDVHLYQDHLSQASEQMTRQSYRLPKLYINNEFWITANDTKELTVSTELLTMLIEDFQIEDYESHPTIKAPLLN